MRLLEGAAVRPAGDAAVVVEFGDRIDPALHDRVLAADRAVGEAGLPGVEESVPSYRSLLLRLDPLRTTPEEVAAALRDLTVDDSTTPGRMVEVPVDFDRGEDLATVAERTGTHTSTVIELLTSTELRVYLHGFAPGFAYLGGIPPSLHVPRRATPRSPVPAGSVLLAAGQAALCPTSMPTGWWVVGHTGMLLFDEHAATPVPFLPGDRVRLVAST